MVCWFKMVYLVTQHGFTMCSSGLRLPGLYGLQNNIGLILSKTRQNISETWATGSWMGSFMMPFCLSAQVFIVHTFCRISSQAFKSRFANRAHGFFFFCFSHFPLSWRLSCIAAHAEITYYNYLNNTISYLLTTL